jgi:hypothetical protein
VERDKELGRASELYLSATIFLMRVGVVGGHTME